MKKTTIQKIRSFIKSLKHDFKLYGIVYSLTPEWLKKFKLFIVDNLYYRYNVIKIKSLDAHWTDRGEILLHANFQILLDFVDKEWIGSKHQYNGTQFDIAVEEKRLIEDGADEDQKKWYIESIIGQNKTTQEIWDLYNWWKNRPNRKSPEFEDKSYEPFEFNDTGIGEPDENRDYEFYELKFNNKDPEKAIRWNKHIENFGAVEEAYDKEDDDMLDRLIKIRKHLHT